MPAYRPAASHASTPTETEDESQSTSTSLIFSTLSLPFSSNHHHSPYDPIARPGSQSKYFLSPGKERRGEPRYLLVTQMKAPALASQREKLRERR